MNELDEEIRPLVAVSLKMYFSAARTRGYLESIGDLGGHDGVELAVLPTFPLLESTAETLRGTPVTWGAQDVAPSADGAQTGEVSAPVLAELGCRYVEIGHAERRRLFGESAPMLDSKLAQTIEAGLIPLYCVGEPSREADPAVAGRECLEDLERALEVVGDAPIVVAYEPIWAIGAPEPAPADYVRPVCTSLRDRARQANPTSRVVYGGAAGPGTYTALADAVDGLFLGRFAHDVGALERVLDEVAGHAGRHSLSSTGRPQAS